MSAPLSAQSATFLSGTADPSTGAGVVAPVGVLYVQTTPARVWQKQSASNTAWVVVAKGDTSQRFSYAATGTETADFFVDLPAARASGDYLVQATSAGTTAAVMIDCPSQLVTDRTTTQFRVLLSAPPSVNDRFEFCITDRT